MYLTDEEAELLRGAISSVLKTSWLIMGDEDEMETMSFEERLDAFNATQEYLTRLRDMLRCDDES